MSRGIFLSTIGLPVPEMPRVEVILHDAVENGPSPQFYQRDAIRAANGRDEVLELREEVVALLAEIDVALTGSAPTDRDLTGVANSKLADRLQDVADHGSGIPMPDLAREATRRLQERP